MSYYWFNREKILKNAWDKYLNKGGKQKAAKYYADNQKASREVLSIKTCQRRKRIKK